MPAPLPPQLSRTLALAMRGTWDLQAARRVLQRQLAARAAHISQLEEDVREAVGKANDVCGERLTQGLHGEMAPECAVLLLSRVRVYACEHLSQ